MRTTYVFFLTLITLSLACPIVSALPAGFQEFYLPLQANITQDAFVYVSRASETTIGANMHYIVGVTASADNTVVYYDHWENGLQTGTGADEIVRLNKGQIYVFEASNVPANARGTSVKYDGGDRIFVSGSLLQLVVSTWPESIGTVLSDAWEIYPTKAWNTQYVVPVGQDIGATANYADFARTTIQVMSATDGNTVTISPPGSSPTTVTLNRGQAYTYTVAKAGTSVTGTAPVQVQIIAGDNGAAQYSMRGYTITPRQYWGTSYYAPVPSWPTRTIGTTTYTPDTDLFLYNPNPAAITVQYQTRVGSGSFSIPASSTRSFYAMTNGYVPTSSGVYLSSNSVFWGLGSCDTRSATFDWAYSLVPEHFLGTDNYISWAPGTRTKTLNHSPVFITATTNRTTVYVYYAPDDGVPDQTFTLDRLQSIEVFDPDNDNSGMHVVSTAPVAMAWGQSPRVAGTGDPSLDMGYTTLPLPTEWIDIALDLQKTAEPTQIRVGGETTFTLNISVPSTAGESVTDLSIVDKLPPGWQYIPGSTKVDGIAFPDPTPVTGDLSTGYTLTWNGTGTLVQGSNRVLAFRALSTASVSAFFPNRNVASVTGTSVGATLTADSDAFVTFDNSLPGINIAKSGPSSARIGEEIRYTFNVTNTGNLTLSNVTVNDELLGGNITGPVSGDDGDGRLNTTEVWVYEKNYTVPMGAPNPLENTATVTADYQGIPTSDLDDLRITLDIAPGINLAKGGPASARIGEEITYTFNVTNTGNVNLSNVTVTDPMFPGTYPSGNITGPASGDDGDGVLELGEEWYYTANHTVPDNAPNPLVNNATVSGDYLGLPAVDDDPHTITLDIAPGINLAKGGPASATIGETITYTFNITNTGNVPLSNVTVFDDKLGGNITGPESGDDADGVLELGEEWNYTATYVVPVGAPNPLENNATVTADFRENPVIDTDPHVSTLIIAPGIELVKSGPTSAQIGETVTYTFNVTNVGNVPLSNVSVVDDTLGGNITGPESGDDGDGVLEIGEEWRYEANYTVRDNDPNPILNTATASGDYLGEQTEDSDDHTISFDLAPALNLVKVGPASARIGDTITYTFNVTNVGNVPLSNVKVSDPMLGNPITGPEGGDDGDGVLEIGEEWNYSATYTVRDNDSNPLLNTATARGDYHEMPATDSDDHTVSLNLAPGINVAKEGPTSATIGETITYSFTLTNIGNVPLSNVTVNDPLIGGDGNVTGPDTGDDGDGILELTETWVYIAPYTIPTDAPNPIPNTATARGDYQEMPATDSDDHTVSLNLAPGINVAKEGPVTAALGETITYTFTVTNIGNVPLRNVTVNDPLLGGDGNVTGPNTGDDGDGILEIGEVWNYTAIYTVPTDASEPITNMATASGDYRGLSVSVTDVYTVALVVDPEITFAKFGPNTALVGEMVTYWFEVWNTGTVPLRNVTVKDAILGGTGNVTGPTSGDDDDGVLDVDEIWVYTATYEIPPGAQNPLINTATATADFREIPASGTANHAITLNTTPGINLVKDGPASASVGQTITYTFRVTNTGNVPLSHLVLSDPILGGTITGPASGDTGNDQVLGRDEVWVYTQTYTVPQGTSFPLRNVARIAADYAGMPVQDEDDHTVNYYPGPAPAMILVKSGPTSAYTGETITYTFRMTNSGSVPLTGVTLTDQMLGGTIVGPASGDLDHDQVLDLGETWIYTADYTVPAGAPDPLRNTAIARAIGGSTETLSSYSWDTRVLGPAPSSTNTLPTGTTTVTATSTVEPTETDTIEPTGSPTVNVTDTVQPTGTPTVNVTDTVQPTGTPTVNVTDTVQPTGTPTVNVTDTVQPTGTPTVNVTDTVQPTGTPTVNVTDTVQPTGTPTVNVTDTVQPTGTPTVNVTDTVQPTGTPTVNVTDTVEPTATMTVTVTATPTGTPTKTPTVTATKTPTQVKTPTLTVTPAKTPAPTKTATKTPTVTKTPTKTTVPTKTLATPSTPEGRPTTGKTTVPTTKATTAPGTWPTATDTTPGSGNPTETTGPSYPSTTEPSGPSDTTGPGFPTTTGPSGPSDTTRTRTPSTTGPAGGTTTGIPSVSPTAPQTISPWPSVTIPADLCPVLPGPTGPVTVIDRSTVIEAPGYYVLGTGVVNTTAAVWLDVRASDVTIDGMGRRIDGVDRTGSYGIRVRGDGPLTNVTIYNLTVTDFAYGIAFERVSKGLILHVDASSNTYDGIQVIGGHDNRIECSIIHRDDDGINLVATDNAVVKHNIITENVRGSGVHLSKGCNGATVLGNIIGANDEGIEVDGVSKALIRGNRIFGSRYYGLNLTTATDLSVVDNAFNNTANLRVPTGPFSGTWCQEPPMLGPNVMGNLYVGGNYWGTPNRTGFSDLTPDANGDGFVDEACTLPGGIGIDRYPLGPSLSVTGETGTPGPTGTNAGSGSDSDPYAGTPSGTDGTERPAASGRDGVIGPEATISGSIPASTVPGLPVPSGGIPASTTAPSPTPEPGILLALAACGLAAVFFSRRG